MPAAPARASRILLDLLARREIDSRRGSSSEVRDGDLTGTRFEGEAFTQLLFSEPMPEQFGRFAVAMGCDPEGERVQESTDIATTTYRGCDDDVPLVFYEVIGGGHAWPSSPLAEPDSPVVDQLTALQGYTTFEINATTDAWAFFEQHALEG